MVTASACVPAYIHACATVAPATLAMVRALTLDTFARREAEARNGLPLDGDLCDAFTARWIEAADRDPLAWFTPVIFVRPRRVA